MNNLDQAFSRLQKVDRKIADTKAQFAQLMIDRKVIRGEIDKALAASDEALRAKPDASAAPPAQIIVTPKQVREANEERSVAIESAGEWPPERIRRIMSLLDLSRSEFALRLGVTEPTVANWVNGVNSPARAQTLTALIRLENEATEKARTE